MNEGKFVPVMITPFNSKMEIDFRGLEALIDFYLAAGAKGLFANCLSSEMYSITDSEKLELTRYVVNYVKGRVPVVATGSFGATIEDKAGFTKRIADTGINAAILVTGHYAKPEDTDEELLRNFEKMFSLTGNIPLGMYECPAPYKRIIGPGTFKALLEANRMIYHKDTSLEPAKVKAKIDILKQSGNALEFYDAHTPNAQLSLQAGAKGMSSISGNFYPEIMVWMVNNAKEKDRQEEVKWLQEELNRVDPLIHIAYPVSAKYFLQKRGLPIDTASRVYTLALTADQKKTLDEIHERFLTWCERLSVPVIKT